MSTGELSPRRRRRRFLVGYDEADLSVKREPDEDIKDYAETTMNELLGWYGYEKVDSRDTQGLNLTHFASNNPTATNNTSNNISQNGVSPPSSAIEGSDGSEETSLHQVGEDGPPSRVQSESASPGPDVSSTASDEVARQHQQMVSALSSVTKHPGAPDSPNLPPGCIVCAWCQKVGMKLFTLKTHNGCKAFCSELCFTQCRRASFKKNKICDWCKHVRHTVNYVDFQDGEQQLQFCSDKCLNQYKMNIFCKETQAHLQMHTHLKEAACKIKASGPVNLITPELWLRDCKINGISTSPLEATDTVEEVNSDENLSTNPSPTFTFELSRPNSPVEKEKEQKQEPPAPFKDREKTFKKSSVKNASKKVISENKHHSSNKHYRDKKANGLVHSDPPPISRHSPIQASPSHIRTGQVTNGATSAPSLLSPPPISIPRPPQHHLQSLPPRHCPPPIPTQMGMGGMEPGRQNFIHPNMMPPPFQFLAQQQMEAFLRSQHGVDMRSKAPPHVPFPPWAMPPFPPIHPPHQPPLPPPPPPPPHSLVNSKSPSLSHSSSPVKSHHQSVSHKSNHQNKHKHSRRSTGHPNKNTSFSSANSTHDSIVTSFPPSLLPPVTVMVPFPIVLPIPLPIPVPLPIPPEVAEKYRKLRQKESDIKNNNPSYNLDDVNKKRKSSTNSLINKKLRKTPLRDVSDSNVPLNQNQPSSENIQSEEYSNPIQNLSFKDMNSKPIDCSDSSKPIKSFQEMDPESRSYSPLSEELSSYDEDMEMSLHNGGMDSYAPMNFSNYSLNLTQSSPVSSQESERHIVENPQEFQKSPSPTNLSLKEIQHSSVTPSVLNFKKKHLREQLSLVDMNQCI